MYQTNSMCFGLLLFLSALIGTTVPQQIGKQRRLNDFIQHYEELSYDAETLHAHHNRAKRSATDPYVDLKFKAHGRSFHLRMQRDTSVFSSDFKREMSDGTLEDHDTSYIYKGQLWDEPDSQVYGSIINGVFAGLIKTPKSVYHVEKAEYYFGPASRSKRSYHSIIYADHHVDMGAIRKRREAHGHDGGVCGNSDSQINQWMNQVQNSAEPQKKKRSAEYSERPLFQNIYSQEYNKKQETMHADRKKRATANDNRRTCALYLQSDTILWEYMTGKGDKELGLDDDKALEEITSLFSLHVAGVKTIYSDTIFEYSGLRYTGFSFVVRRVKINTTKDCENKPLNRFCERNVDVSNFLNLNSLQNHNEHCLAYVFTHRDFTGGTLGLAWVGSHTRASGGICEQFKAYTDTGAKVYKSLNTGIVTLLNYGNHVPPKVSVLTFAHELGHNFGSPHDDGAKCVAGADKKGNFIMFASATSGDLPNNKKFSDCSIGNITLVLDTVLNEREGKENCFGLPEEAFCGNNLVEVGEDCDCGYEDDCEDPCCYPRTTSGSSGANKPCKLRGTAQCSPSAGPCCSKQCRKIIGEACKREDSCSNVSLCDGKTASCPAAPPKANYTSCNDFTQICMSGECVLSICNTIQWEQCYLKSIEEDEENQKEIDKATLCFVACQNPITGDCVSSGDSDALAKPDNKELKDFLDANNQKEGIKLSPGAPCDDFKGYCDVFQKCRGVDADGPLARLKNLLLSKDTLLQIRNWIVKYWWAVLLMVIAGIILMGLFITVCAVHTPSSNPKRAPARKISLMTHRPQRNQGPPPGYSNNPSRAGPPHGKGRGPSSSQAPPAYNPAFQMNNQQQRV